MEIYNVPEKARLLYLNAQYFHNDCRQGVAEHVIKIQYKVRHGTEQAFVMPLSLPVKEINRKARAKLSLDGAAAVKAACAQMKGCGKTFGFGFRQVTVMEKAPGGPRRYQRRQDPDVFCWVFFEQDHVRVDLSWRGRPISIRVQPHKGDLVAKQSVGIGYWDRRRDPELATSLATVAADTAARRAGEGAPAPEADGSVLPVPANSEIAQRKEYPRQSAGRSPAKKRPERTSREKPSVAPVVEQWGMWQPESQPKVGEGLGRSFSLADRLPQQVVDHSPSGAP